MTVSFFCQKSVPYTSSIHVFPVSLPSLQEDCEGNACGSETIAPIDLIITPVAPVRWSGSGSGLKNLFKDSSPLGDRTKYAIKRHHDVKLALWWKHAFGAIQVLRNTHGGEGVSAFLEKSITKVWCSTLLAFRGGGVGVKFPGKSVMWHLNGP